MAGIYRFINVDIPTVGCNLRCEYCYIRQHGDEETLLEIDPQRKRFLYPVDHMIKALSAERMGGICMFNISGSGETLLCPEILEITEGLLKNGHYVALINNCTVREKIEQMAAMPEDYRSRLFFKVSFHYRELKKRKMLEEFADNINLLKKSGIGFSIEIVSNDYVLDELDELKEFSMTHFGALPHVLTGRDERVEGTRLRIRTRLSPEEYHRVWSSFNSDLFAYQQREYDIPHREFCYAGVYTGTLSLGTGNFTPCPGTKKITNIFEDIEDQIRFVPVGRACPFPNCYCGFFLHVLAGVSREYDPGVFFHQFRDRVCSDGSCWLTPTIREAFSHRCSEYNQPYPKDKAFYLDLLMRKVYKGLDPSEEEMSELIRIVAGYLKARAFHKVAVYGMGVLGNWLMKILLTAGIEVVCAMDRRFSEIECDVPVLSPDDALPAIDAVIVSVFSEFTNIAPKLREKTPSPIISIVDLAD